MRLVDTNVLLYAVDDTSPVHEASRHWLDRSLSGHETVALSWHVLTGFVRIATKAPVFETPLTVDEAVGRVDAWLASPASVIIEPTARHTTILLDLLRAVGSHGGDIVNDAHLAALAIEHRAGIVSYDTDFARFPGIAWSRPG